MADNNGQTVTRPQTPRGQVYVPNPPRTETYTGTRRGDGPAGPQRRSS